MGTTAEIFGLADEQVHEEPAASLARVYCLHRAPLAFHASFGVLPRPIVFLPTPFAQDASDQRKSKEHMGLALAPRRVVLGE